MMRSEINQLKKQVEILNNYNEFYQRERNYINLYINKHILLSKQNNINYEQEKIYRRFKFFIGRKHQ